MKNEYKLKNKITELWRGKEEKIKGKEKRGEKVKKGGKRWMEKGEEDNEDNLIKELLKN
jgi:hypothetical protein